MMRIFWNGGFLIGFNRSPLGHGPDRYHFVMVGPWTVEICPFKMTINEGCLIPRGYGACYVVMDRRATVFYPRPFNYLIRWMRRRWEKFLYWEWETMPELYSKEYARKDDGKLQQVSDQAELRGYQLGYRDGVRVHKEPHPLDQWEKVG